jgi:hypothetical protein
MHRLLKYNLCICGLKKSNYSYSSSKGFRSFLLNGLSHESGNSFSKAGIVRNETTNASNNKPISSLGKKKNKLINPRKTAINIQLEVDIVFSFFM